MKHLSIDVSVRNLPELDLATFRSFPFYGSLSEGRFPSPWTSRWSWLCRPSGRCLQDLHSRYSRDGWGPTSTMWTASSGPCCGSRGGFKVYIAGDKAIYGAIPRPLKEGTRAFDEDFMAGVYEHPFGGGLRRRSR